MKKKVYKKRARVLLCNFALAALIAMTATAATRNQNSSVPLMPTLPKPTFTGTPIDVRAPHREPYRGYDVPPPQLLVPEDTRLLSTGCRVSCSAPKIAAKELALVTDGDKQFTQLSYLELPPGLQWVQIDLTTQVVVQAICIWREQPDMRVYRDTIVQLSNDPEFSSDVITVFNNDYDNSTGLGKGGNKEYFEDHFGRRIKVDAVQARYLRVFSNGNTSDPYNHFTEIEVYGDLKDENNFMHTKK